MKKILCVFLLFSIGTTIAQDTNEGILDRDRDGFLSNVITKLDRSTKIQEELNEKLLDWRNENRDRTTRLGNLFEVRSKEIKSSLQEARQERIKARKEREGLLKKMNDLSLGGLRDFKPFQNFLMYRVFPVAILLCVLLLILIFLVGLVGVLLAKTRKTIGL